MNQSTMNVLAGAVGSATESLGTQWMLDPAQFEASASSGYPHPFAGYFAGRAGVLGDVDAPIVEAAFLIFEASVVKAMWEAGKPVHGPLGGAKLYFGQAAEWARPRLDGIEALDQFTALGERVIDSVPIGGLPVFAGWRALPRVEDPAGRAMQVALVMRELRGGIHLAAMVAHGLLPVEAHLLNKGSEYCAMFGWSEPYPSVEHLRPLYAQVQDLTNDRMVQVLASCMDPTELAELSRIAEEMNEAATAKAGQPA